MIPIGTKANFETILKAAKSKRLALVEVFDSKEQKVKQMICAVNVLDEYEMIPLAVMIDEDPYARYQPPNPDGGYFDLPTPTASSDLV